MPAEIASAVSITAEPIDARRCRFMVDRPVYPGRWAYFAGPEQARGALLAERADDEGGPTELPVGVRARLERLVSADPYGGRLALASIVDGDAGPEGRWLWTQAAFAALASDLSQQAIIFVVTPAFAIPRRVFKVSWEQELVSLLT